jgi:hypothetical protein
VATICVMAGTTDETTFDPLDQGYRLHARTTPEISGRVDNFLTRLKQLGLKFRKGPPKVEPFINVLVLEFFKLPVAEQEALMMREIPRFRDHLAGLGAPAPPARVEAPAKPGAKVTVYEDMPAAAHAAGARRAAVDARSRERTRQRTTMHILRLGPEHGCNMAHYIRHEPAPDDPGTLHVRFLPGETMALRGPERDAFLRRIDEMDPPPTARGRGERGPKSASPRVTVHEDLPAPVIRPRQKRRRV